MRYQGYCTYLFVHCFVHTTIQLLLSFTYKM